MGFGDSRPTDTDYTLSCVVGLLRWCVRYVLVTFLILTYFASVEARNRLVLRLPHLPQQGSPVRAGRQQGPQSHSIRLAISLILSIQIFRFATSKNESLFLQRKNPRKIAWTQVYRRMHKKGITEEVAKKRSRRTVKHQRGIVGADLAAIAARRNQTAAIRAQQRTSAIQKAKAEKKAKEDKKEKSTKVCRSAAAGGLRADISPTFPASRTRILRTPCIEAADEGWQGWPLIVYPVLLPSLALYDPCFRLPALHKMYRSSMPPPRSYVIACLVTRGGRARHDNR